MNRHEEATKRIRAALGPLSPPNPLLDHAAECIISSWQAGYCETTQNPAVYSLIEGLWCKWCGKLHYVDEDYDRHQELLTTTGGPTN